MRKLAAVLTILLLVGSVALGQDVVPGPSAGSKGMLFSFSGLSNLGAGTYEGGFGLKLYISDYMAVRGVVQLGLESTTTPANPGIGQTGTDGSSSDNTFGVGGAIEMHFTKSRVSPYMGAGILFATRSTEEKDAVIAPAIQTTVKNANGATSISIGVLLGVEYYVTNSVSLSAEYQLGFTSLSYKDREETASNITVTTKRGSGSAIGIGNSGLLTLAVYF